MYKQELNNQAGALAIDAVPTCNPSDTADTVRIYIQKNAHSFVTIDYVYVLVNHTLAGVFSIHELMSEKDTSVVENFMQTNVAYVHALTDKEHVAQLALAQSIKAVPVADDNARFMGVVTADAVFQILSDDHANYLYKTAGIRRKKSVPQIDLGLFEQIKTRIPWLILGLFGGLAGAAIVNFFERSLTETLFVAAFIPAIVYIADAVGNQSEMLVVRALSREKNFSITKYLSRELGTGFFISLILGCLMYGLSFIWLKDVALSLTLAIAILATTMFSVLFTVTLPWILKRLGFDPAVASGPLATVICDVSSVTIYLIIATTFL
jgi:magnesium transporter